MLDHTPQGLYQEVLSAEETRDHVIAYTDEMVREYVGQYYRNDQEPEKPVPRPFIYEFFSQVTPNIVFDNPRVEAHARAAGAKREDLKRLKHGVNRNVEDVDAWWKFLLIWYDTALSFGACRLSLEPQPGFAGDRLGRKPLRPTIHRLPPHHYIQDSQSGSNPREPRWRGHMWAADKDDLLNDPRYRAEAVRNLAEEAGMDQYHKETRNTSNRVPRNQVVAYDIWVPEIQTPGYKERKDHHGTIFTIGAAFDKRGERTGDAEWLRPPRPFFGPKEGPYELFGIYSVPDQVYPLSPLTATRKQQQEYNTHANAAARNAARHKKFLAVNEANTAAANRLKRVKDGEVVKIPGLTDGQVQEMELGGESDRTYNYLGFLADRLERATGLTDAAMGITTGEGTATEQAQAQASRDDRLGFMARMYQDSVQRVLQKFGWYIWHSKHVDMELSPEAAEDLAPRPSGMPEESEAETIAQEADMDIEEVREAFQWNPQLWLRRGTRNGFPSQDSVFEHAMITIEPLSMERTSEPLMQKRKLEWMNLVTKVAPLIRQYPEVDWVTLLDQVGQTFNQKDAGELINERLAHQLGGYGEVMQQMPGAGGEDQGGVSLQDIMAQAQGQDEGQGQAGDSRVGIASGAQQGAAVRQ